MPTKPIGSQESSVNPAHKGPAGPMKWLLIGGGIALASLLGLCVILGFVAAIVGNRTSASKTSATAISVNAQDLGVAYRSNEINGDANYKGKVLKVDGVVSEIMTNPVTGAPVVMLEGTMEAKAKNDNSAKSIECTFPAESSTDLARLHEGDYLTVLGNCISGSMNVRLSGCSIVPNPK